MPFSPKYAAQYAGRLLDHIQTVLERDVNSALAVIDSSLATVIDFDTPIPFAINFPALYLEPEGSKLSQAADDSHIDEEHTLLISLAIVGKDPDALKSAIVKYVRAVDQALRTASETDFTGGLSAAVGPAIWEVTEHRYRILGDVDGTIYRKDAQLVLTVQIMEK